MALVEAEPKEKEDVTRAYDSAFGDPRADTFSEEAARRVLLDVDEHEQVLALEGR